MGWVAICPVIVPKPELSRREVAMLALLVEVSLHPGKEAHSMDEAVEDKSDLGPYMYYMMRTGISIPWTMQDGCMSPWILDKMLLGRPKRKILKKKT